MNKFVSSNLRGIKLIMLLKEIERGKGLLKLLALLSIMLSFDLEAIFKITGKPQLEKQILDNLIK
jgi:hypothetical protein